VRLAPGQNSSTVVPPLQKFIDARIPPTLHAYISGDAPLGRELNNAGFEALHKGEIIAAPAARLAVLQGLSEAGYEQQRVVDAERQTHHRGQAQGHDVQLHEGREDPQNAEAGPQGSAGDDQRDRRRDRRAEDEQQDDHQQLEDAIAGTMRSPRAYRIARGHDPYRPMSYALVAPRRRGTIGRVAEPTFERRYGGLRGLRDIDYAVMARVLGGSTHARGELLSFPLFDHIFITELLDMGRRDAMRWLRRHPRL
jgi:hypothetical protein